MTSVMPIQTKFMLCLEKCIFGVFISFSFCIWCFQFESINICRSFKFLTIHGNLSVNTEKSDKREFLVTASLRILQVFLKKNGIIFNNGFSNASYISVIF